MQIFKSLRFLAVASATFISACAVPVPSDLFSNTNEKDYENMYLRGVFNWWEATEAFRFQQVDEDTMSVEVELIADGQPYDFKVADNAWSPVYNCGLPKQQMPLVLDDKKSLYCFNDSLNLQFVPPETATYRFEFDISNADYPELTIMRVN